MQTKPGVTSGRRAPSPRLAVALLLGLSGIGCAALRVESTPPGAEVWIDGEYTGKRTPVSFKRRDLPAIRSGERHQVVLRLETYESPVYQVERKTDVGSIVAACAFPIPFVLIGAARGFQRTSPRVLRHTFWHASPGTPMGPGATARPASSPMPAAVSPVPSRIRLEASVAGAEVYIDGRFVGTAPITALSLPEGTYQVEVRSLGHATYRQVLTVYPGSEVTVRAELVRQP